MNFKSHKKLLDLALVNRLRCENCQKSCQKIYANYNGFAKRGTHFLQLSTFINLVSGTLGSTYILSTPNLHHFRLTF